MTTVPQTAIHLSVQMIALGMWFGRGRVMGGGSRRGCGGIEVENGGLEDFSIGIRHG
jgi:hypothetical protein